MVELNTQRLVKHHLVTDRISLYIGYSRDDGGGASGGQMKLTVTTNSNKILMKEFINLYHRKVVPNRLIRQIGISFCDVLDEYYESYDLFTDIDEIEKERNLQLAIIEIKEKFGKNAIFKGMNKLEKATTIKRNTLVGGHNAN